MTDFAVALSMCLGQGRRGQQLCEHQPTGPQLLASTTRQGNTLVVRNSVPTPVYRPMRVLAIRSLPCELLCEPLVGFDLDVRSQDKDHTSWVYSTQWGGGQGDFWGGVRVEGGEEEACWEVGEAGDTVVAA